MAFYYGSGEESFLAGFNNRIDRMRTQRQKNKELFDKWKADKLANGESVTVDDMIAQRETLAGGDNYFIGGLATDAQMKKMAARHNNKVAQTIYNEATDRMKAEVEREELFRGQIDLSGDYKDFIKNTANLFGGDTARATEIFESLGGEEWFNETQQKKRDDRVQEIITNDSRYTRAESDEDLTTFFKGEDDYVMDQLKKARERDARVKVDTELEKLEAYIGSLDDTELLYTDQTGIKNALKAKYPNLANLSDDLDLMVQIWEQRATSRRTALGHQQKSNFLTELGNDKTLMTLISQQGFDSQQVRSRINTIALKYPHLSEKSWATEQAFETWIGDTSWMENQMRFGYTGQFTETEKTLTTGAVAAATKAKESSAASLTSLADDEQRKAKSIRDNDDGATVPPELAMFEKGGAGRAAIGQIVAEYIIDGGMPAYQKTIQIMQEFYKLDPGMSSTTLADSTLGVLMKSGLVKTETEHAKASVSSGLVAEGFTIAPGETIARYGADLLQDADRIVDTTISQLQTASRSSYAIENGVTVFFGNSPESSLFAKAIATLESHKAEVLKDFNGERSNLFADKASNSIQINGVTVSGTEAGAHLVQEIDKKIAQLREAKRTVRPEIRNPKSVDPHTGLTTGTDIFNSGIDERLPANYDYAGAYNNPGQIYEEMSRFFNADPEALQFAKEIVENSGGNYKTAAIRLRNVFATPNMQQADVGMNSTTYGYFSQGAQMGGQTLSGAGYNFKPNTPFDNGTQELFFIQLAQQLESGSFDPQ